MEGSSSRFKGRTRLVLTSATSSNWDPTKATAQWVLPNVSSVPINATNTVVALIELGFDCSIQNVHSVQTSVVNKNGESSEYSIQPGAYHSVNNLLWELTGFDKDMKFNIHDKVLEFTAAAGDVSVKLPKLIRQICGLSVEVLKPGIHTVHPIPFLTIPFIYVEFAFVPTTIVGLTTIKTLRVLPDSFKQKAACENSLFFDFSNSPSFLPVEAPTGELQQIILSLKTHDGHVISLSPNAHLTATLLFQPLDVLKSSCLF